MANIETQFFATGSHKIINKGGAPPPWYTKESDVSKWYDNTGTHFFYNKLKIPIEQHDMFIQHGLNERGWAAALFLRQTLHITNQILNDDNSLTVTYEVKAQFFKSRITPVSSAGWQVKTDVYIGNVLQYQHVGNTRENFTYGAKPEIIETVTIKPEQLYTGSTLSLRSTYPNGESPPNRLDVGFSLYNPNPATYIPMAIRKGNNWKDLDTNKGIIKIRKGSSWIDKSEENVNTSRKENKGKNRIRKNSKWYQLPRMKNDKPL